MRLVAEAAVPKLSLHAEDTCSFRYYCRTRALSGVLSSFSVNHAPRQPASLGRPDRDPTRNLDAVLQSFTGIPSSFMWVMAPSE